MRFRDDDHARMPHGANLWNTVSTTVAPAARAASTRVFFTHAMSSGDRLALVKVEHDSRPKPGASAKSFTTAGAAVSRVIRVLSTPTSNRFQLLLFALRSIRLPLFLLLARRSSGLYAFDGSYCLGQLPSGSRTNAASPARSNSLFLIARPSRCIDFFSAPISRARPPGRCEAVAITFTSLTFFAAFLLLFARGFRSASRGIRVALRSAEFGRSVGHRTLSGATGVKAR